MGSAAHIPVERGFSPIPIKETDTRFPIASKDFLIFSDTGDFRIPQYLMCFLQIYRLSSAATLYLLVKLNIIFGSQSNIALRIFWHVYSKTLSPAKPAHENWPAWALFTSTWHLHVLWQCIRS